MILDNSLAHTRTLDSGLKQKLKILKPFTRRYMFNEDASHKAGRFAAECTDIICRNAKYAVRPFPNTYIEIDNRAVIRGGHTTPHKDAPERLGFWWTENGSCFVMSGNDHKAEFTPFIYAEHGSHPGDELRRNYFDINSELNAEEKFRLNYEMFKQYLMIGHVPDHLKLDVDKFSHNLTDLYEIGLSSISMPYDILDFFFQENIGTFKCALSCLFLLDERIKRQLVHVKAAQKVVGGKLRGIAKHDTVTIDLDVPAIRKVYDNPMGHHDSPIQHDVSEHWTTYDVSTQCSHDWKPYHSDRAAERDTERGHTKPLRREVCSLCGGRRTRKPVHVRGDAEKGSTVGLKKYRVIASKEKEKEKP